jgi:hypothetical protein
MASSHHLRTAPSEPGRPCLGHRADKTRTTLIVHLLTQRPRQGTPAHRSFSVRCLPSLQALAFCGLLSPVLASLGALHPTPRSYPLISSIVGARRGLWPQPPSLSLGTKNVSCSYTFLCILRYQSHNMLCWVLLTSGLAERPSRLASCHSTATMTPSGGARCVIRELYASALPSW